MKLERGQELYSEYRDGSLSPAMKLALEQHLQSDPIARKDFEEFDGAMKILEAATFEELEAPHGFRASVMERVAAAHAAREEAPQGFLAKLANWFGQPHRKELTGAVAGLAAVAVVVTAVLHPATSVNPSPNTAGPAIMRTLTTTIRGVETENGTDGNVYHNFQLHLPESVSGATISAYVVTETGQILDPAVRDRDATPALATPIHLSNNEAMKIPVGLLKQAPSGSTLNMLVTWKADSPSQLSGSQVVFTPVGPQVADAAQKAPPANGNLFDSLQTIAAAYNVTIIADSTTAPTASATPWKPGDSVSDALKTVADSEGYVVDKLDSTTYLVHLPQ